MTMLLHPRYLINTLLGTPLGTTLGTTTVATNSEPSAENSRGTPVRGDRVDVSSAQLNTAANEALMEETAGALGEPRWTEISAVSNDPEGSKHTKQCRPLHESSSAPGVQSDLGDQMISFPHITQFVRHTAEPTVSDDREMAIQMFQLLKDEAMGSDEWADAKVINSYGEALGRIEDMVVRMDGSDAGFVVAVGSSSISGPKALFVSVDDLEACGAHFIWDTELRPEGIIDLPPFDSRQFVSVSRVS